MKYIYGLVCPVHNEICYIGQSSDPQKRYIQHLGDKSDCSKARWIQSLAEFGMTPTLVILELVSSNDYLGREASWINFGIRQGWQLRNDVTPSAAEMDTPALTPHAALQETILRYEVPMAIGDKITRRWWNRLLARLYDSDFVDILTVSYSTVDMTYFDVHYLLREIISNEPNVYIGIYDRPALHFTVGVESTSNHRMLKTEKIRWKQPLALRTTDVDEIPVTQHLLRLPEYVEAQVIQ